MWKYLLSLLLLFIDGYEGTTLGTTSQQIYCSKDKGEEVSAFHGYDAEIFCTQLEIQKGDLLRLKNQTVADDRIFFVELISVNGIIHENTLDLFPKVNFILVYKSNVTEFSLKSNSQHLDVTNSSFPKVTNEVLKGCKKLITLGFMSNPGLQIDAGAFKDLKSLAYLVIINQTIPRLYRRFLEGQENLENLILNVNDLSIVDEDAFIDLPKLEQINLDDNPIEYFKANISSLTRLEILSLANTKLKQISLTLPSPTNQLDHLAVPTRFLLSLNSSSLLSIVPKLHYIGLMSKDFDCPEVKPVLDQLKRDGFRISTVDKSLYLKNLVRPSIC